MWEAGHDKCKEINVDSETIVSLVNLTYRSWFVDTDVGPGEGGT